MNIPLSEQYRPTSFDELIGGKELSKLLSLISVPAEMPNLLLCGSPGVGKTSAAKILLNKLKPIDYIRINGSDTTGVDTIRDKVYNFMTSMSTEANKPKLIWIEEFDFMSANAYAALRSMMEQFMSNARFICTCNYMQKIPEPIQSRFTIIEFKKPKDEEIFIRAKEICELEKISVSDDVLKEIISKGHGDIRTIINNIQQLSANATKTISTLSLVKLDDITSYVYSLIMSKEWSKIRYEVPNKYPDYNKLLVDLEELFFNSDLSVPVKARITEIISTGLFEMSFSFDNNICFAAVCSKIIKEI